MSTIQDSSNQFSSKGKGSFFLNPIICPHCSGREVKIITKKGLLKKIVIQFSIAIGLFFIATLALVLKNWLLSACVFLVGFIPLLSGLAFYVKYTQFKKDYMDCGVCKRTSYFVKDKFE